MGSIGGSIFVHNALEFDYCIKEAILSLCEFCDEVIVVDAESTDGTLDILRQMETEHNNMKVIDGIPWSISEYEDKSRLVRLANTAKGYLNTPWHFMLQADEVIHESSIPYIKEFVMNGNGDSCLVRRLNLWGEFDKYIKSDSPFLPCSTKIVRLGKIKLEAYGDAESFQGGENQQDMSNEIIIFHYGLLRNNIIGKVISMQSWFWGKGATPDPRYLKMRGDGGIFQPYDIIPESATIPIFISHPKYMEDWINERKNRTIRT